MNFCPLLAYYARQVNFAVLCLALHIYSRRMRYASDGRTNKAHCATKQACENRARGAGQKQQARAAKCRTTSSLGSFTLRSQQPAHAAVARAARCRLPPVQSSARLTAVAHCVAALAQPALQPAGGGQRGSGAGFVAGASDAAGQAGAQRAPTMPVAGPTPLPLAIVSTPHCAFPPFLVPPGWDTAGSRRTCGLMPPQPAPAEPPPAWQARCAQLPQPPPGCAVPAAAAAGIAGLGALLPELMQHSSAAATARPRGREPPHTSGQLPQACEAAARGQHLAARSGCHRWARRCRYLQHCCCPPAPTAGRLEPVGAASQSRPGWHKPVLTSLSD